MNLRTIAEHLEVNPSNASRTCDQLVTSGKVARQQDKEDGRNVHLSLCHFWGANCPGRSRQRSPGTARRGLHLWSTG